MQLEKVIYEKRGPIVIATINNEEQLNGLSPGVRRDMNQAWNDFEADPEARIMIITGKGRAFCAGADISEAVALEGVKDAQRFLRDIIPFLGRVETLKKPVIAAVNGLALGGGLELAISCDIIIASEKAQFGVPEAKIGVVPGFAVLRLHQIIGRARSKELTMTCKFISAEQAYQWGLVNRVVPHEQLLDAAIEMANDILPQAPMAVEFAKSAINRGLGGEEYAYGIDGATHLFGSEDQKEGMTAFMEKRKPNFKGR